MISLSSILVDEDAGATHHPALEQAAGLARRCGARVKIDDVLPWVPSGVRHFVTPDIEKELIAHRRERLSALVQDVSDVPVTVGEAKSLGLDNWTARRRVFGLSFWPYDALVLWHSLR